MAKSRRPYLIRAIYEWAVDCAYTPHLVVAADYEGVHVPREYVQEGRITLNISPHAVQALELTRDPVRFWARFGGRAFEVIVPCGAVLVVFAKETGEGVVFGEVEPPSPSPQEGAGAGSGGPGSGGTPPEAPKPAGKGHLRVVK